MLFRACQCCECVFQREASLKLACPGCRSIYASILEGHLGFGNFEPAVRNLAGRLVDATLELHKNVSNTFLPSAVTFHYQFNLRELSSITQVRLRWQTHAFSTGNVRFQYLSHARIPGSLAQAGILMAPLGLCSMQLTC